LDLDAALAILITQIGGSKRKTVPISKIAESAKISVEKLKSAQEVANRINRPTARSQIKDFIIIDDLPHDVKVRYVDKRLIGIEAASELRRIKDNKRVRDLARELVDVKARDAMQIIDYAKKHESLPARKCKDRILDSKDRSRHVDVLVISLEQSEYSLLKSNAKKRGKNAGELAKEVILDWLKSPK